MSNPLCHWELTVRDPAKAKAFYRKVFDWQDPDRISIGILEPNMQARG